MEAIEHTRLSSIITERASPRDIQLGLLDPLRLLLFSRVTAQKQQMATPQVDLALRWATGKVNFIRHHGKRPKRQAK